MVGVFLCRTSRRIGSGKTEGKKEGFNEGSGVRFEMKFSKFAEYLTKLEATSKRLELIDIMADLFHNSESVEVGKIAYLLQGRVAPFYEPIEYGMSENLVALA